MAMGEYTADDEIFTLWPQAAAELAGFAAHLKSRGITITASQLRMALVLAQEAFEFRQRVHGVMGDGDEGCGSAMAAEPIRVGPPYPGDEE